MKRSSEVEEAKSQFQGPEQLSSWQLSDTSSEVNEYLEKEDFRVISKKDKHNQEIVTQSSGPIRRNKKILQQARPSFFLDYRADTGQENYGDVVGLQPRVSVTADISSTDFTN